MSRRTDEPADTTQSTQLTRSVPRDPEMERACVVVIHGEGLGMRRLVGDEAVVIGRAPEADLRIDHPSVSRRHCEVRRAGERYRLRDLGSKNRTRLNEHEVDEATLTDGDHIQIGQSVLKFISRSSVEARYHEELYQLATHDALTGLMNRRHFIEQLEAEILRSQRHGRPLALAIVDVDHFKRINDEYGHAGGDEVLRRLGAMLTGSVAGGVLAARIGGEEFALLFPETAIGQAREACEALRRRIEAESFPIGGTSRAVTASIGLADVSTAPDRARLMAAADAALYRAKADGRNRVRHHEET